MIPVKATPKPDLKSEDTGPEGHLETPPESETRSNEALMPGKWEEVEEESSENPYFKAQIALANAPPSPNPKKRERYEDDESALEQMEAESRIISASSKTERIPERYKASSVAPEPSEDPLFKKKVAKGANIKKRAKMS